MSDLSDDFEGGFIKQSPPSNSSSNSRRRSKRARIVVDIESSGEESGDDDYNPANGDGEGATSEFEEDAATKNGNTESDIEVLEVKNEVGKAELPKFRKRSVNGSKKQDGKTEPKKKRAKKTTKKEDDGLTPAQKHFNRMENGLRENHPELRSVFEDLAAQPATSTAPMDQPPGLNITLLPFQREGLGWLVRQEKETVYKGGILADEMGMGKTIQTIALFLSDTATREFPILVIAPTVAVMQWKNEIEQYTTQDRKFKVLVYHGANRTSKAEDILSYDIILTTYAVVESVYRRQTSGFTRNGQKVKEPSVLHTSKFHRVVLDEAHNIKDRQAGTSRAVFMIDANYRLCLSGTPLQNRIGELYSLLRFLRVDPFSLYFCTKCECKSTEWLVERQKCLFCGHVAMQHVNYFNHSLLKHIQRIEGHTDFAMMRMRLLLSHIMLRRTKVERADDLGLPPRVVTVRRDFFNEEEKDLYSSIFSDSKRQFSTYVNSGVVLNNYANIFTLITRMRQIADHPDLVLRRKPATTSEEEIDEAEYLNHVCKLCDEEAEDAIKSRCNHTFCRMCIREYVQSYLGREQDLVCPVCQIGLTIDLEQPAIEITPMEVQKTSIVNRIQMDNSWRSSTKIEALVEELFRLRSDRRTIKSIVFSQFTSMLDLVEWRLARAGFKTVKLQGNMSPHQRDSIIKYFMNTPSVEVFLVSLKAGGVALNLCEASQVFLLDPWWNPSVEWQSGDRVHRIGQHRPVKITRLVIEDSIESRIIELQAKKANMINATIGSDDAALNRLSKDDMEFLFQN